MVAVPETGRFLSLGKECAAYNCSSRSYYIQNNERKPTGNNFFHFTEEKFEIKDWCNLIKRQDGKDGFKVTKTTVVCSKHFRIFSLPVSTDHMGEQGIHLRKDQDLYFTTGITLEAT